MGDKLIFFDIHNLSLQKNPSCRLIQVEIDIFLPSLSLFFLPFVKKEACEVELVRDKFQRLQWANEVLLLRKTPSWRDPM